MSLPDEVILVDVSPRDGLQNESQAIDTAIKIELVQRLLAAGLREVEAASFVSPRWVPQMADGAAVMAGIRRPAGARLSALVPNLKGFEAAHAARVDEIVVFTAASEAFAQRNINCSIAESIERFRPVVQAARTAGIAVRASISCALGCPYQGEVEPAAVVQVVRQLAALGCQRFDVADTIGVGTPARVQRVMQAVGDIVPLTQVAGHFHDTYGQAVANVLAALQVGVSMFHASVAGLGGCPYAKGATGNVATEDVVYLLHGMGIRTGVDLDALVDTGQWISACLQRRTASRAGNAIAARRSDTHAH